MISIVLLSVLISFSSGQEGTDNYLAYQVEDYDIVETKYQVNDFGIINNKDKFLNSYNNKKVGVTTDQHTEEKVASSCEEATSYTNRSGPYVIKVPKSRVGKFYVFCKVDSQGGKPWTIIQRNRDDTTTNFSRNWRDYSDGFGDVRKEFFVGLANLHALTSSKPHELIIQLEDFSNKKYIAHYTHFEIGNENQQFYLRFLENFSGNTFNSLHYHIGQRFSTYDSDNDSYDGNCARIHQGGWWYNHCIQCDLNGRHHNKEIWSGIIWTVDLSSYRYGQHERHKKSSMAIRPTS